MMCLDPENLTLTRGDTWKHVFDYLEPDEVTPVDLTGVSARLQLRPDINAGFVELLTTVSGEIIITPLIGRIALRLPAARSGLLSGVLLYDLELTYSNGDVETIVAGTLTIVGDVTR